MLDPYQPHSSVLLAMDSSGLLWATIACASQKTPSPFVLSLQLSCLGNSESNVVKSIMLSCSFMGILTSTTGIPPRNKVLFILFFWLNTDC